jgi:shikimate kinase
MGSAVHVVVVGAMAVGKSTVGRRLAEQLGRPFRDSDDDLGSEQGVTGRQLALRDGVDALHRWEAEHLARSLAGEVPAVVAAAASIVDDPTCRAALADHVVVWLRASAHVLALRLVADDDHRRDLGPDPEAAIAGLEARRAERFASVADVVVDVAGRDPDDIVSTIVAALPPSISGLERM